MKPIASLATALVAIALSLGTADASDWVAVYALKVVMEPTRRVTSLNGRSVGPSGRVVCTFLRRAFRSQR
jgi:hypothetical protein